VAHTSQIHAVPEALSDDAAVMVEPAACAVHAALRAKVPGGGLVAVLGAGTLGLCVVAALRRFALPGTVIVGAKHPDQQAEARRLGADVAVAPAEVRRAVRPGGPLPDGGGAAVGRRRRRPRLRGQRRQHPRGAGHHPARREGRPRRHARPARLDLAPLWQREIELVGAYAYGTEELSDGRAARTFDLAFELAAAAELGRLVSARYPLERYREAIEHAATAGSRGAVKIVFEPVPARAKERHG